MDGLNTASEMTYTVSGGALNSAQPQPGRSEPANLPAYACDQVRRVSMYRQYLAAQRKLWNQNKTLRKRRHVIIPQQRISIHHLYPSLLHLLSDISHSLSSVTHTFILRPKLHYTDIGYGHHQRTSSQQVVDVVQHVRSRLNLFVQHRPKLHYADTGYGHVHHYTNRHHQRTSS